MRQALELRLSSLQQGWTQYLDAADEALASVDLSAQAKPPVLTLTLALALALALAAQPRKSYNEVRSCKEAVAALFDRYVKTPLAKISNASQWFAGRYWSPIQVGTTRFWQPDDAVKEVTDGSTTVASLVNVTEQVLNEWVHIVFCTLNGQGYTWKLSGADGQLLPSCPGGQVLATDRFYSSHGSLDASEARLQASHRLLREQLLSYPWEVKESVEQVILKTPSGHVVTKHSQGPLSLVGSGDA